MPVETITESPLYGKEPSYPRRVESMERTPQVTRRALAIHRSDEYRPAVDVAGSGTATDRHNPVKGFVRFA